MNIITKRSLSRRTILRGLGATLALPLLDGMVPALAAGATSAKAVRRLGIVYIPNGIVLDNWKPKTVGTGWDAPVILKSLDPFREYVNVLSGLAQRESDAKGDGSGDHARAGGGYLSSVHVRKSEGLVEGGVSMDQIAAAETGKETQLGSLEISLDTNNLVGSCDQGYSCAYTNTISWRSPTMPLMTENDPRAIFERLFGESSDPKIRQSRLQENRSLLDSVTDEVTRLSQRLGSSDRHKMSDYLESVRDVERRIQKAEEQNSTELQLPTMDLTALGVPNVFEDHAKLMFDLMVLAYQSDMTRVITFMFGREITGRSYPQIGVPDQHHGVSHHGEDPEKLAKNTLIQTHHVSLFSYYLEKLKATPDGDGSLLDHVMLTYGSSLGNSDRHYHYDLATLLVGGGAGAFKGGRHIQYPDDTPLSNLHLTLLDRMNVPVEKIGDSTGKFTELVGV